ncbi:hypothetical protein MKW98_020901 [Papaver atlanticum]|uniref:Uncharacterized protein n=1 Tax=Papaver atlanticum TaxID=357466 RepID=A0AAD4THL7_9MAGN|nr:hypothetical protein MKW98_020901 [Papaver atlanticum]
MVVNIAACVYSALSLILIGNQCDLGVFNLRLNHFIVSLLLEKVCNVFDRYCRHTDKSILSSLSAALMFVLLLARAVKRLHRRCL